MEIQIKSLVDGAKEAEGVAVIIDVLRASSTITTILAKGAEFVIPLEKIKDALDMIKKNPDYTLASDKRQLRDMGYYDNSPTKLSEMNLKGKKFILLTTNGTRCIVNTKKADEVIVGSFVNVSAIINYLKKKNELVTLVPVGKIGEKSVEDESCAEYIKNRLEGRETDIEKIKKKVKGSTWAQHLIKTNRKEDVIYCLNLDKYNIVPRLINGKLKL